MTTFLLTVLGHAPHWAWAILAAMVALGLAQARDHAVSRRRLLVQPLALGALSLYAAVSAFGPQAAVALAWLAGAALGAALNRPLRLPRQVRAQPDGRFSIGGSWAPLALLMLVFWLRFAVAASLAVVPALAGQALLASAVSLLYGASAGLLASRAWRVLQQAPARPERAALAT
jgi:hypothetical protein